MKANEPIVNLKHIEMNFKKKSGLFQKNGVVNALHDIDLSIYPGEVMVVVGESGSGKSTMANVIAGLLKPTQGEFSFHGIPVDKMSSQQKMEYRNKVQMVQQDSYAALNPMRRMIKTLGDPLIIKKLATAKNVEKKVAEFLETVELTPAENYMYKYSHQLSGGQRQRMLIARAISMNPQLILADEPVSMIDVSLRVAVLNLLAKLNEERQIAIMYITHDLATARYVGKDGKIAVMYLGQIIETGNLQEVLANPQHPYLRALLSAVPIPNPRLARLPRESIIKNTEENGKEIPSGCRFHNRCAYCQEICKSKVPIMTEYQASKVACHLVGELPPFKLYQTTQNSEPVAANEGEMR